MLLESGRSSSSSSSNNSSNSGGSGRQSRRAFASSPPPQLSRLDALAKQHSLCRRPSNEAMLRCLAQPRPQADPRLSGTAQWATTAQACNRAVWGADGTGGRALVRQRKAQASSNVPLNYNPLRGERRAALWDSFQQEWVAAGADWQRALDYRELCR